MDSGDSLKEVQKKVTLHLIYLLEAELVCLVRTNVFWWFGLKMFPRVHWSLQ